MAAEVPPHSLEAEAAVLSAIFIDAAVLDRVHDRLRSHHFYADANRWVYEAIVELRLGGLAVDIVLVSNWLRDRNRLAQVGGTPYLGMLQDATPAVANIEEHAKVVVEKWRLRELIRVGAQAVSASYAPVENPQELLERVEQEVSLITHDTLAPREEPLRTIAGRVLTRISNARARGESITGVPTGFTLLDRMTGGLFDSDLTIVAGRPGLGKAQPLDAKLLTPNGWITMGVVRAGDVVIGSDGCPTRVLEVFERGELEVYRVLLDDGGATRCCHEHLWHTRTRKDRREKSRGSVKTLREVAQTLERAESGGLNHSIPFVEPVQYSERPLPLHPYLLGVYLGDGVAASSVIISNPERDIQEKICGLLPEDDEGWVSDEGKTIRVRRKKMEKRRCYSETKMALVKLGLENKRAAGKFIPQEYLHGSVEQRLALLRGLCDTDGYVVAGNKGVEYTTASPELCAGVIELVGSLGGRISTAVRPTHYTKGGKRHECQPSHRMVFFFPNGLCPVSSAKHLRKWDSSPHRIRERFIRSVEPVGRRVCRCIRVAASNGLYVTDDYIVTHNTSFAQSLAANVARPKHLRDESIELGHAVLFCTLEQPREQLAQRFASHEAEFDVKTWRAQRITEAAWQQMSGSFAALERLPIYIDDTPALTLGDLRSKVRRLKRQIERGLQAGDLLVPSKPLRVVIVDYLQLMRGVRERGDTREREVASLTQGLKNMAKQESIAVIALSQLNRELEKQKDRRPQLKDLRESGALEQDADNVWLLYRESYYDRNTPDERLAELDIGKQRNGPNATIELVFRKEYTRYYNLAVDQEIDEFDDFGEPG